LVLELFSIIKESLFNIKAGVNLKFCKKKIEHVCFYRNLNLKVLKFYFEKHLLLEVQSSFSQNEVHVFLPLRRDILERICPRELTFSGFVVLRD